MNVMIMIIMNKKIKMMPMTRIVKLVMVNDYVVENKKIVSTGSVMMMTNVIRLMMMIWLFMFR